jgi:hypothetical protein
MKGILISVNSIPHAYSEILCAAFELSIQDRNELKDDWQGSGCLFDTELGYAKIVPGSIIPAGKKAEMWHIMNLLSYDDMDSDDKVLAVKDYIANHF